MRRYQVRVGEDFEIDAVDIDVNVDVESALNAKAALHEAKTRSYVTAALLVAIAIALGVAGSMWFVNGNFEALMSVWTVVAVPLGWIGAHYYQAGS